MSARWLLPTPDTELGDSLARQLGVSHLTAQVLINRGLKDADSARAFLNPQLNDLADPDLLPDIEAAVERTFAAARNKEKVLIYGDYDVDGTTATALLVRFLRLAGLDVDYYVPHRIQEGYGLNIAAIEEFKQRGVDLIITVDCGVGSVAECEHARAAGIDVIVTDHHEPGEQVASACAVVDPKLTGHLHTFRELSGVGVAFKLAWAVAKRFSTGQKISEEFRGFLLNSLGLVALGTVADVVPLLGENRVLVRYGLKALSSSAGPGLRALMDRARIRRGRLSSVDVAFGLGPRLNAAGRMADAALAIDLMITDDGAVAQRIAETLDRHNVDRQKLQNDMFQHAREMVLQQADFDGSRAIVLAHDSWHPGVVGIVASKLVDEFNRPTALIAIEGGVGRGSARSVPGNNRFDVLDGFRDRMNSFGGHAAAAGFQITTENIPGLREHLNRAAKELAPELFQPSIQVDAEVELDDLSERLISELELLAPHGQANRRPLFVARGLRVAGKPKLMGMKGQHISFYVSNGKASLRVVGFGLGDKLYDRIIGGERSCSVVFSPRIDTWRGSGALELQIKDIDLGP